MEPNAACGCTATNWPNFATTDPPPSNSANSCPTATTTMKKTGTKHSTLLSNASPAGPQKHSNGTPAGGAATHSDGQPEHNPQPTTSPRAAGRRRPVEHHPRSRRKTHPQRNTATTRAPPPGTGAPHPPPRHIPYPMDPTHRPPHRRVSIGNAATAPHRRPASRPHPRPKGHLPELHPQTGHRPNPTGPQPTHPNPSRHLETAVGTHRHRPHPRRLLQPQKKTGKHQEGC